MNENNPDLGSEGNISRDEAAATPPYPPAGTAASQPTAPPPAASQPGAPPPSVSQPMVTQPMAPPAAVPPSPWSAAGAATTWNQTLPMPPGAPAPAPPNPPLGGHHPPRPMPGWVKATIGGVAAAAIALGAGGIGGYVGYSLHDSTVQSPLQTTNQNHGTAPIVDRSSLASIAAAIQPTVVDIKTRGSEGSGVVISADGYIVTNNHVVEGARGQVQIGFNSGKTVSGTIVGTDPKTDLAVVKADASGLSFAEWGDSDAVQVGDTVLAIGSPLGLQGSVTAGIISALHRTITVDSDQLTRFDTGARTTIGDAIQTDAPINPGNSGGALVNTEGKVIGINSAILTGGMNSNGNIGVGFAISANKAKSVTAQLIKGEKVSHPYLGVSVTDAGSGGAQIQQVVDGGPADKAGLRPGDIVTKIDNRDIGNSEDLVGAVQSSKVGAAMTLTVQRDGSSTTVTATVGEAP